MKTLLKKAIPTTLLVKARPWYHGTKARLAAARFHYPGRELTVVGITGTKGKTTTATFTGRLLNLAGIKAGYITTSVINTGDEEFLNPHKMTTIDGVKMQHYLRQMVSRGCTHVVVELSSQGLEQHRHWGLGGIDAGVFLNIYPEHIEAHGSFEKYVAAKARMFAEMRPEGVVLINEDFPESSAMWAGVKRTLAPRIRRVGYSAQNDIRIKPGQGIAKKFKLVGERRWYPTNLIADFDIANAYVAALTIAHVTGRELPELLTLIAKLKTVPGRMEWVVREGKDVFTADGKVGPNSLNILVDYAHEPASMEQLLRTLQAWKKQGEFANIVHVVSCDGVGRDDWKKPIMGELSHTLADYSVYTTDNYEAEDNPEQIVATLQENITPDKRVFAEIDRQKAFAKALEVAESLKGPTVIVSTGVGTEQGLTQPSGVLSWDERAKWIEACSSSK